MASRIETEMSTLRLSLEKALEAGENETVLDILKALEKLPISIELLKSTKIGNALQDAKKKLVEAEAGVAAKNLIAKWKKDCEAQLAASKSKNVEKAAEKSSSSASTTPSIARSSSCDIEDEAADDLYDDLSPIRKTVRIQTLNVFFANFGQIMDMFTQCFKLNANTSISKFLAFNVESSIDALHSSLKDQKLYVNKAKSLAFNLKKNEVCTDCLIFQ